MTRSFEFFAKTFLCAFTAMFAFEAGLAQDTAKSKKMPAAAAKTVAGPKVTQIDIDGLKKLLKPNGKPLLLNFWATWCGPCREEFPDLVKLEGLYKGKVDFATISLDDLADIDREVPKFLAEMKAEMPAYLLRTEDESAAITLVSKDWAGSLPLTVVVDAAGNIAYQKNGKMRFETVKENIDRVLGAAPAGSGASPDQ